MTDGDCTSGTLEKHWCVVEIGFSAFQDCRLVIRC